MQRRARIALAGTVVATAVASPWAARADNAPPGDASAVAGQVTAGRNTIVAIGHTTAHAGSDGASATANALEVGGQPLASQFGGTQKGAGEAKGAFLDTGPNKSGRLEVAPWAARVTDDGTHRHSHGEAALGRVTLGDPTTSQSLVIDALQSSSDADWTASASQGRSSSDGLLINAGNGQLVIDVLHAEADSSGQGGGSSYLASVNGNQIGTSQNANGNCALTVPSLLSLSCLTASGGPGSAAAQVLNAAVGDQTTTQSATATLVAAAGTGHSAATVAPAAPAPAVAAASPPPPAAVAPAPAAASELPRTGANLWFDFLAGMALIALGGVAVGVDRLVQPVTNRG